MKSRELFLSIKQNIRQFKSKVITKTSLDHDSINYIMSMYNLENYNNIINSSELDYDDLDINDNDLKDFCDSIDYYFSLFDNIDIEFKQFIKLISLYLVFIANKPLHPPGIEFSNGARVYEKGGNYYCTGKRLFIDDKQSLCKYCIAQIHA